MKDAHFWLGDSIESAPVTVNYIQQHHKTVAHKMPDVTRFPFYTELEKKNHFQYKFGEDGSGKSFILDLRWGEQYPEVMPEISMETFYNRHLKPEVKEKIDLAVREEAEPLLGMSMTYTLFEFVKGELDSLLEDQPEVIQEIVEAVEKVKIEDDISCKTLA